MAVTTGVKRRHKVMTTLKKLDDEVKERDYRSFNNYLLVCLYMSGSSWDTAVNKNKISTVTQLSGKDRHKKW